MWKTTKHMSVMGFRWSVIWLMACGDLRLSTTLPAQITSIKTLKAIGRITRRFPMHRHTIKSIGERWR